MSAMDAACDFIIQPNWVRGLPRWIGFPLFVIWFLILLVPFCIFMIPACLWEFFSEARS